MAELNKKLFYVATCIFALLINGYLVFEYVDDQQEELVDQLANYKQGAHHIAHQLNNVISAQHLRREQLSSFLASQLQIYWQKKPDLQTLKEHFKQLNKRLLKQHNISIIYTNINGHLLLHENISKYQSPFALSEEELHSWAKDAATDYDWQVQIDTNNNKSYYFNLFKLAAEDSVTVVLRFEEPLKSSHFYDPNQKIILLQDDNKGVLAHDGHLENISISLDNLANSITLLNAPTNKQQTNSMNTVEISHYQENEISYLQLSIAPEQKFILNQFVIEALNAKLLIFTDAAELIEEVAEEKYELFAKFFFNNLAFAVILLLLHYHLKIKYVANHDTLTGLLNRVHYTSHINEYVKLQSRSKISDIGVIAIDIDHFKHVNDTFGHSKGDKVLKLTAEILKQTARTSDFIYRFGGEEFLIVCINENLEGVAILAERLRQKIEQSQKIRDEINDKLTISVGVTVRAKDERIDETVGRADALLYMAKKTGRNKVVSRQIHNHKATFTK